MAFKTPKTEIGWNILVLEWVKQKMLTWKFPLDGLISFWWVAETHLQPPRTNILHWSHKCFKFFVGCSNILGLIETLSYWFLENPSNCVIKIHKGSEKIHRSSIKILRFFFKLLSSKNLQISFNRFELRI